MMYLFSPVFRLQLLEVLLLEVFDVPPVLQPVHVGVEGKFEHMFNLETKHNIPHIYEMKLTHQPPNRSIEKGS